MEMQKVSDTVQRLYYKKVVYLIHAVA